MKYSYIFPTIVLLTFAVASCGRENRTEDENSPSAREGLMKITFESTRDGNFEIYSMNDDGSNVVRLTQSQGWSRFPAWSPDGSRIMFSSNRLQKSRMQLYSVSPDSALSFPVIITDIPSLSVNSHWSPDGAQIVFRSSRDGSQNIWKMNLDGSDPVNLTNTEGVEDEPAWSPDGTKIAFVRVHGRYTSDIWVMDSDGSNQRALTEGGHPSNFSPSWSPDSSKILFVAGAHPNIQVHVMNADGSEVVQLTHGGFSKSRPAWAPDGSKIAFGAYTGDVVNDRDIFLMNPDGSDVINITNSPGLDDFPSWSPVMRR